MTYSIVMHDPGSGALGVAVQSHFFNAGRIVPWLRAGVGAVATQALADPMYGPRALDLMASGSSADQALDALLAADDQREMRQVAVVDAEGRVAAHTGSRCIRHAAHHTGDGWSVQANIMRTADVVPAMAEAAGRASGSIADRLLAALQAAEAAGGDLRGSQSAALLVADDGPVLAVDLRIDDHPDPIAELSRLRHLHSVYQRLAEGGTALAAGDHASAAAHYAEAAADDAANSEVAFWQCLGLAAMGHMDEAVASLRSTVAKSPDLAELLERLAQVGFGAPGTTPPSGGADDAATALLEAFGERPDPTD